MIGIVDYNMGNLGSVKKVFDKLNIPCIISHEIKELEKASKFILPGVGHFGNAIKIMSDLGLIDFLNKQVLIDKKPILGICLGMQLMTKWSEEGDVKGLGWIDAEVLHFNTENKLKYKVPHIGWNSVKIKKEEILLKGVNINDKFYFVHSYYVKNNNTQDILTSTDYEIEFTSSFQKENIFGFQFHPEKSHEQGVQILQNFSKL